MTQCAGRGDGIWTGKRGREVGRSATRAQIRWRGVEEYKDSRGVVAEKLRRETAENAKIGSKLNGHKGRGRAAKGRAYRGGCRRLGGYCRIIVSRQRRDGDEWPGADRLCRSENRVKAARRAEDSVRFRETGWGLVNVN